MKEPNLDSVNTKSKFKTGCIKHLVVWTWAAMVEQWMNEGRTAGFWNKGWYFVLMAMFSTALYLSLIEWQLSE